jgi:hypothetical protein
VVKTILRVLLFMILSMAALAQSELSARSTAPTVLRDSLRAMGGEEAVRGLHSLQFKAMLQRNALEQSERPEGPYIAEYDQITEWRDVSGRRWKRAADAQFAFYKFASTSIVAGGVAARVSGSRVLPGGVADLEEAEDIFDLSPERILLTALATADARRLPDVVLQSVSQQVVAFTWEKRPVKIFLNSETHLPTAVEWARAYPGNMYWNMWGDVTTRVYYSVWWLAPGDLRYPLQLDYVRNGLDERKITITDLHLNEPISDDVFAIPDDVKAAFQSHPPVVADERPLVTENAQDLGDGIVLVPGPWNTVLVKQADGIVVIEAPISSGYSSKLMAEAERRYPGTPIKAVISTSDSWPHIGGVREYVARNVPVYGLDRSIPLLRRLVDARHAEHPDALARTARAAKFFSVSAKTTIGTGPNRLEIYPIRGDTAERQMMVYFPERRLLYGSDPFQKGENGFTDPNAVSELRNAVVREHLDVDTFFMMHIGPTPWKEVLAVHGSPIPQS